MLFCSSHFPLKVVICDQGMHLLRSLVRKDWGMQEHLIGTVQAAVQKLGDSFAVVLFGKIVAKMMIFCWNNLEKKMVYSVPCAMLRYMFSF